MYLFVRLFSVVHIQINPCALWLLIWGFVSLTFSVLADWSGASGAAIIGWYIEASVVLSLPVDAALIKAAILRLVSCCWAKSSRCSFSVRHHSCHSLRYRRSNRLRSLSTATWLSLEEVTDVIIFLTLDYCLIRLTGYNSLVLLFVDFKAL